MWGSRCSPPLPSPRTVPPVEERGGGAATALVMVEDVRSAGAALLCTQHTPAAPWVARVCLTAVPQSCSCKLHEPAPLGASEELPTHGKPGGCFSSLVSYISLNEDSAELTNLQPVYLGS